MNKLRCHHTHDFNDKPPNIRFNKCVVDMDDTNMTQNVHNPIPIFTLLFIFFLKHSGKAIYARTNKLFI